MVSYQNHRADMMRVTGLEPVKKSPKSVDFTAFLRTRDKFHDKIILASLLEAFF